ncbi:unnamed protein product [Adineta ricciae]|uniref:Uncharacterized protein n=1 Tax=Adineta ricciae TaxID=249248 RepID=A0A814L7J7_ADIRI|nr:unnamed protein product [Adineta ricciae]CAF1382941.1 unnamed protein product [Adineta ricciae]
MPSLKQLSSTGGLLLSVSVCLIVTVFVGIAIAIVLSLIPTYTSKKDLTPLGEVYCINNLLLYATLNTSTAATAGSAVSGGYPLNQACYRLLQQYQSDTLIQLCSLTNCILANATTALIYSSSYISCSATVYYSTRCSQSSSSGVNNTVSSSGNSGCRTRRMNNINGALGSTWTNQYTNVPSAIISSSTAAISNLTTVPFSNYTQTGTYYCGSATQSAITAAISNQTIG